MREFLIIIGLTVFAIALRACKAQPMRKLGAFLLVGVSFLALYFLTDSIFGGVLAIAFWILLPWFELLTRVRKLRLPVENRLLSGSPPRDSFFPHACEAVSTIEEEGFEHVGDSGWDWAGMHQHFRNFWHPEECAIASVCLCQQENVAFAFISVTTRDKNGNIWRTTNFPFSPSLKVAPGVNWKHLPCEQKCFRQILHGHREFVKRQGLDHQDLLMPDPESIDQQIEKEMKEQIAHNLENGLIEYADQESFRYSWRGLIFLWRQLLKDMIRLC